MMPEDIARAFFRERDRHGKWLTLPEFAERVGCAYAKAVRVLAVMLPKLEVHVVVLTGLSASPTKRLRVIDMEVVAWFVEVVTVDDLYEVDGELRSLKEHGERSTRMLQAIKRVKPLHEVGVDDVALENLLISETSLQEAVQKEISAVPEEVAPPTESLARVANALGNKDLRESTWGAMAAPFFLEAEALVKNGESDSLTSAFEKLIQKKEWSRYGGERKAITKNRAKTLMRKYRQWEKHGRPGASTSG